MFRSILVARVGSAEGCYVVTVSEADPVRAAEQIAAEGETVVPEDAMLKRAAHARRPG